MFVDKDGVVVARGRNRTNELCNATVHAELDAISQLSPSSASDLSHLVLYVSVEPCIMCASALRQLSIQHVIYGCSNPRFGGCGGVLHVNDQPDSYTPPYTAHGGYQEAEAVMLLRQFYITENTNAPKPKRKMNRVLKPYNNGDINGEYEEKNDDNESNNNNNNGNNNI